MESMNPLLHLLIQVRLGIERGEPLRGVLKSYVAQYSHEMTLSLIEWVMCLEQGRVPVVELQGWKTAHRRAFLQTLSRGARGESILPALINLEQDIFAACEEELERRSTLLPMQCLVPLLLFQFPALMMVILGPLLSQLVKSM